jgi:virginiamycin B lyase
LADAHDEMRRLMTAYAESIHVDSGLRARIVANVSSRRQGRTYLWLAYVATGVITVLLVAMFVYIRQPGAPRPAATPTFTTFTTSSPDSMPSAIVEGPDGAIWLTERGVSRIGRISQSGDVKEYPLPKSNAAPTSIAVGSEGALWFTAPGANEIGRITTAGQISEYSLPTPNAAPQSIALGPDGNLWFTELAGNKIGRIGVDGTITEFELPRRGEVQCGFVCPYGIARGLDGALWFTESQLSAGGGNRVGRLTTDGQLTEYPLPSANALPTCITAGRDLVYVCESRTSRIAEVGRTGAVTERELPDAVAGSTAMAAVATKDGRVWIVVGRQNPGARGGGEVAILGRDGSFTTYKIPASADVREGAAVDASGQLWFVAGSAEVMRMRLDI